MSRSAAGFGSGLDPDLAQAIARDPSFLALRELVDEGLELDNPLGGPVHGEQGEAFLQPRPRDLVPGRVLLDQAVEALDRLFVLALVVVAQADPVQGVVSTVRRREPLEELLEAELRG